MCKYQHDQRNKEIRNWEPRHVCLKREVLQVKYSFANFYLQKRHNFAEMTVSKIQQGVTWKKVQRQIAVSLKRSIFDPKFGKAKMRLRVGNTVVCLLTNLIYRLIRSHYVCTLSVGSHNYSYYGKKSKFKSLHTIKVKKCDAHSNRHQRSTCLKLKK